MTLKHSFEDSGSNPFDHQATNDLSHLVDGLNPFRESMSGGNMLSERPDNGLVLPGSESEQTSDIGLDQKQIGLAPSLGSGLNTAPRKRQG